MKPTMKSRVPSSSTPTAHHVEGQDAQPLSPSGGPRRLQRLDRAFPPIDDEEEREDKAHRDQERD